MTVRLAGHPPRATQMSLAGQSDPPNPTPNPPKQEHNNV